MDEELKVRFIGEDTSLATASKNAVRSLDGVTASTSKVGAALQSTGVSMGKASQALANHAAAANKSMQVSVNLGRVLQDANYGFIGIANNLNPLLESFQRLSKETGGLGGAMKSLGSSLMGAGGIGLALSAFQFVALGGVDTMKAFAASLFGSGETAEAVQKKIDELTASIQYLNEEAARISNIFGSDANIEVAKLKAAGADEQKIYEAQLKALEKKRDLLRDTGTQISSKNTSIVENPNFSLKTYELLKQTGEKLTGVYSEYDAIYKEALKNEKDYYDNEEKIQLLTYGNQQRIREDGLKKQKEADTKSKEQRLKAIEDEKKLLQERMKILLEFQADFEKLGVDFLAKNPKLANNMNALTKQLRDELNKVITEKLPDLVIKIKLDQKAAKEFSTQLEKLKAPSGPTITNQTNQGPKTDIENFRKVGEQLGEKIGPGFGEVFGKMFSDALTSAIESGLSGDALESFKSEFEAFSTIAAESVGGIASAFGEFTDALLEGKNAMQAFGNALIGTFKQIAKQLITDIALAAILSALSGGASGGGVSFLKAFKGLIGGSHASGLYRVPKDNYVANLHKGEMVVPAKFADVFRGMTTPNFSKLTMPSLQMPNFSADQFRSGNMSAAMVAPMDKVANMTGHQSIEVNVTGEFKQSGRDLMAVWAKTVKNDRIFSSSFLDDQIDKRLRQKRIM